MKKVMAKFAYVTFLTTDVLILLLMLLRLDTILLHRNVSVGITHEVRFASDAYSQLLRCGVLFALSLVLMIYGICLVHQKKLVGYLLLALPILAFLLILWGL